MDWIDSGEDSNRAGRARGHPDADRDRDPASASASSDPASSDPADSDSADSADSDPGRTRIAGLALEDQPTHVLSSEQPTSIIQGAEASSGEALDEETKWESLPPPPPVSVTRWEGPPIEEILDTEDPQATYVGSEELPTPLRRPPSTLSRRPSLAPAAEPAQEASLDRALWILGLIALLLGLVWAARRGLAG